MAHSSQILIAIDPGASGGIAWADGKNPAQAVKMPDTDGDIFAFLQSLGLKGVDATPTVVIEEVGGYVGVAQPASSAFNFGFNVGFLRGVCTALGWRIELVRPKKWQQPLGLGSARACKSKSEWKGKLKACAQRLFPGVPVTLATADALLILDWASRKYQQ